MTLVGDGENLFLSAITAGGSQAMFFKMNTMGEEAFLDTLSRENRVIFMRRYWYSDSYGDIAALVGMTEKNISVRLVRLRKQLRDHLVKQGVLT